ncbi:hypothetical protein CVT25_011770 [Psilocybe cyanescens]|uniref:Uncharacterized protein n=1 Tax=Psilocybe cyanescens TaxID=93625 RepID=A0A409VV85_PSICY|nr:hypothetical protein CVT25_011770 [Psilocybe cyanescens]
MPGYVHAPDSMARPATKVTPCRAGVAETDANKHTSGGVGLEVGGSKWRWAVEESGPGVRGEGRRGGSRTRERVGAGVLYIGPWNTRVKSISEEEGDPENDESGDGDEDDVRRKLMEIGKSAREHDIPRSGISHGHSASEVHHSKREPSKARCWQTDPVLLYAYFGMGDAMELLNADTESESMHWSSPAAHEFGGEDAMGFRIGIGPQRILNNAPEIKYPPGPPVHVPSPIGVNQGAYRVDEIQL